MLNSIRESTGPDAQLLTDANQNLGDWRNAAAYMMELADYKPLFGAPGPRRECGVPDDLR